MYRYSKSTVTLPDFPIFGLSGPPKFGWSLTCQTLPIFIFPKFGVTDLPIFVFTLPDYREIGSKKSADSKKSGSGTTASDTDRFNSRLHRNSYIKMELKDNIASVGVYLVTSNL